MDSEASVMIHCARGLQEHQVQVEISTRFNRRNVLEIDKHIEAVWNDRVTKEPWLFNGAKFRFHSAHLLTTVHDTSSNCSDEPTNSIQNCSKKLENHLLQKSITADHGEGDRTFVPKNQISRDTKGNCCRETTKEAQHDANSSSVINTPKQDQAILRLQLGLTCYKDFLGTNWSREAVNLQQRGKQELGDSQALLAQPLGVGAVLLTSDGQVVMLRRSQKVAEAAELLDIPGGHPEPKAVCQGVSEETISVELMQGSERAVVKEIFSSVCAEIRDEVNVPLTFLSPPVLMGIALNHLSAGRPSAEFFIRCSLTMEEIKDFYWRGGPEANESTDIVFLSRTEMLKLNENSPMWAELCPSAKGAVLLYQLVKPDHS
ncbi:uridine diphosphate glucose pyrophosphatase NUDT22 [Trichomycterus rosablanca]|uniref:uridine diphosphate glucose pyrophosphatase NUDT22 n=1 Tax=Trichomycterus rosablanca TaxID=2290929 RepID=UPI002F36014C